MSYKTKILDINDTNIAIAIEALQNLEVLGMPSETVYGLAGLASSEVAIAKIFEAKQRPLFDPLILHIAGSEDKSNWDILVESNLVDIKKISKKNISSIQKLIATSWPGPLTLVLPKTDLVPDLATSGLDTVAIRIPSHPVFKRVLQELGQALAAPSANRFGRISPTTAEHVLEELDGSIPYILDGGDCNFGIESSILGIEDEKFVIYRPGSLSLEELEQVLGTQILRSLHSEKPVAPGMLKNHYAPNKKFSLIENSFQKWDEEVWGQIRSLTNNLEPIGLLLASSSQLELEKTLHAKKIKPELVNCYVLSEEKDSLQASKNLFRFLRELDNGSSVHIFAEEWKEESKFGFALRDRMRRASAK